MERIGGVVGQRMKKEYVKTYWEAVKQCLIKFHGRNARQAAASIREYRKSLKKAKVGEIIYHDEPFRVAEGIMHTELNLPHEQYEKEYLKEICGYCAYE